MSGEGRGIPQLGASTLPSFRRVAPTACQGCKFRRRARRLHPGSTSTSTTVGDDARGDLPYSYPTFPLIWCAHHESSNCRRQRPSRGRALLQWGVLWRPLDGRLLSPSRHWLQPTRVLAARFLRWRRGRLNCSGKTHRRDIGQRTASGASRGKLKYIGPWQPPLWQTRKATSPRRTGPCFCKVPSSQAPRGHVSRLARRRSCRHQRTAGLVQGFRTRVRPAPEL